MPRKRIKIIDNKTYYTTGEACEMANISNGALYRWIKEGIIADAQLRDTQGWRLFSEAEIKKIKAEAQKTRDNK